MTEEPLVSVITPCYKHERYLADYFKSVVSQTYSNIELIVADDCSPDNSVEIIENTLRQCANRFVRVKFIKHAINKGVVFTVNELIMASCGKYIYSMASDDLILPNALTEMVKAMENSDGAYAGICNGFCVADSYKYGDKFGFRQKAYFDSLSDVVTDNVKLHKMLLYRNCIFAPCVIYRRKLFEIVGLHDEDVPFEDYDYWLKMTKFTAFYPIRKDLVLYRESVNSLSRGLENSLKILIGEMLSKCKYLDEKKAIEVKKSLICKCENEGINGAIDKINNAYERIMTEKRQGVFECK